LQKHSVCADDPAGEKVFSGHWFMVDPLHQYQGMQLTHGRVLGVE
jgi:hypothetical protein